MEWQPIETAPKDGKEFLAVWTKQGNTFFIVRYDRLHHCWLSKSNVIVGFEENATHWIPLPNPPKE